VQRVFAALAGYTLLCLFDAQSSGQTDKPSAGQQTSRPSELTAPKRIENDISASESSIGKFELLATFTYAKALHDGLSDSKAKQRGIVAAVMGARSRGARRGVRESLLSPLDRSQARQSHSSCSRPRHSTSM
jgi:hypothetical protein